MSRHGAKITAKKIKLLTTPENRKTLLADHGIEVYVDPENMQIIYILLHGHKDTPFEGGQYIGYLKLPPEFPFKGPDVYMLTPNGRFRRNKKICLSNTGYHNESWSPMWGITNFLIGFVSMMNDHTDTIGIAHLNSSVETIKKYAKQSIEYNRLYYYGGNTTESNIYKLFKDSSLT